MSPARGSNAEPAAALEPSPVSAWEDEPDLREHKLPSGRVMTLRYGPSMRRLVREGVVPSTIIGVELVPSEDDPTERNVSINQRLFEQQRAAIVCAMAANPEVTMEPLPGALPYDRIEDQDVNYIVAWAQEGLAGAARFLAELSGVGDGPDSAAVGEVAE